MLGRISQLRRTVASAGRDADSAHLIIGAGALMIVLQLAFRAWSLYPSWFFLDDYNLLNDANDQRLDLGYLLAPYNGHLMPGGRLLAWVVADSGPVNWGLAASFTLAFQATASAAALWMLTTLFGVRWATLAPLAVYLSSAVTVPAMIWWAAALNQVPLQTAFFLAVGAWVRYLRGRRIIWLVWTTCAVLFALLFYVKGVLIFPVLGFLAIAYFSSGSPYQRVMTVLRRDWLAGLVAASLIAGYLTYYFTQVEQIFTSTGGSVVAEIADSMLGTAFATGVLGGPWRWSTLSPPTAYADPPGWTNHFAWVVLAAVILYGFLRRERTLRAWVLLAGYLVGLLALLVDSRAPSFGRVIGLEYRYLTDAMCVVALCLGLAFLPLPGATQSSAARTDPLLKVRIPGFVLAAMVVLVSVSGVLQLGPLRQLLALRQRE